MMIDAIFETVLEVIDEVVFGTLGRMVAWLRGLAAEDATQDAACCD